LDLERSIHQDSTEEKDMNYAITQEYDKLEKWLWSNESITIRMQAPSCDFYKLYLEAEIFSGMYTQK